MEPHLAEQRIHLLQLLLSPCLCPPPTVEVRGASLVIAENYLQISKDM